MNKLRTIIYKVNYKSFLQRTLILFVLVGGIYSAYYLVMKKPASVQKPTVSASSVRISLNQNILAISALKNIDTNDRSTPSKIEAVRTNVDTTLQSYKNELSEFQEITGTLPLANPESFTSQEHSLLARYDQNYEDLGKLVQYSLKNDLGALDKSTEIEEISARSGVAINAINSKKSRQSLSKVTLDKINQTLPCLKEINSKAKDKNIDNLEKLINDCDGSYEQIKPYVLKDILAPLNSSEFEKLVKNIKLMMDQISIDQTTVSF